MPKYGHDTNSIPTTRPWRDGPPRPAIGFSRDMAEGETIGSHRHDYGQLLYSAEGVMRVVTPAGTWLVPSNRAVWIPPAAEHEVSSVTPAKLRNVYVFPDLAPDMPGDCRVFDASRLMRELVMAVIDLPRDYAVDGPDGRVARVLLDQVQAAPVADLHLPMPGDRRLRTVVDALIAQPGDGRTLEDWATRAGASARTLARLFEAETGLSFGEWRRRLRLHAALARLAAGEQVTTVALDVGYDSPSAFIAMFRDAMGETPGAFLKRSRA